MTENTQQIAVAFNKLFLNASENYIFIYTPPKVGSTTLVTSLRVSLGKTYNIIHIHDDIMLNVLTGLNVSVNDLIHYCANIGKNVFVFDVYRSPVERKISEFFEKISPYHFNNTDENISYYNIKRIFDRFNKLYPHLAKEEHYFDKYNIAEPVEFNFDKKYTIQIIDKIKYIKLRLNDSHKWGEILSEILHLKIVLINDYQTINKGIGELYKRFKKEYKLPCNYYEMLKIDKYLKFYYSEEERSNYLEEWRYKLCYDDFFPYTKVEYKFYINLCLENQFYNDLQLDHYIDNGCFCKGCSVKRRDIYFKALNGEQITEKILHSDVVIEQIKEKTEKIVKKINVVKSIQQALSVLNKRKKIKTGGGRTFSMDIL
jgi:hypothetical protein